MSSVTNAILLCACGDRKDVGKLNALLNQNGQRFVNPDDLFLEDGGMWHGGNKELEATVAVCAFNYLDEDNLFEAMVKVEWGTPERVQLLLERPEEEGFSVYELDGAKSDLTRTWMGGKILVCRYMPTRR